MKIEMTKITMKKRAGYKNAYYEDERKTSEITEEQYKNTIDASPFFRSLGGREHKEYEYTEYGYRVTRLTSTSPSRDTKYIREFSFTRG